MATVVLVALLVVVVVGLAVGWVAALAAVAVVAVSAAVGRFSMAWSLRHRFDALAHLTNEAVAVVDSPGRLLYASPSVVKVLGHRPRPGEDLPIRLVHIDDRAALRAASEAASQVAGGGYAQVVRMRHADGDWRWIELSGTNLRHDRRVGGTVVTLRDVSDRVEAEHDQRELEARLKHQADHDELSGLPNRKPLIAYLEMALATGHRSSGSVAVVFVDVDRFKVVNDSLGHQAGDRILTEFSRRLASSIRPGDRAGRFGGDEFVVICPGISSKVEAVAVADRIRCHLRGRYRLGDDARSTIDLRDPPGAEPTGVLVPAVGVADAEDVFVTVSVGVALAAPLDEPADLLRDADAAMYAAKAQGRDRVQLFDGAMRRRAVERLDVEQALRRALVNDEFLLLFQPVVAVADGSFQGAEALLRWEHPERGLLLPGQFLAVAEETGLITELGEWVLRRACAEATAWEVDGSAGAAPPVYVNLAARQLVDSDLRSVVAAALSESGLPAGSLCLEITENALMADPRITSATLHGLRSLGVGLALDDFGTGYSSLSYLKHFPVNFLKIDRAFVDGLGVDDGDAAITAAIIDVAQRLGLRTVAEGVERPDQMERLNVLGCDLAQGFHLAMPMPGPELRGQLAGGNRPGTP